MPEPVTHAHPQVPEYSAGLFSGTVEYYERYRPRYPSVLVERLLERIDVQPGDALLDLACGTGEVSFALVDVFTRIVAVDAEPDMVEAGRRRSAEMGIDSIRWEVGRAEDLLFDDGSFGVVATGRAFHRLNRPLVATRALGWLRSEGAFVDMGIDTSGFSRPSEPWLKVAAEVYERWLPRSTRPKEDKSSGANAEQRHATTEEVLRDTGFLDVEKVEMEVEHHWTVDGFVGYLYSTSYSSPEFWGEQREGFEQDLRAALLESDPSGQLREALSAYFVVGRAP